MKNPGQMMSAILAMTSTIGMIIVTLCAWLIEDNYFYFNFVLFVVLFFATYSLKYFKRYNVN